VLAWRRTWRGALLHASPRAQMALYQSCFGNEHGTWSHLTLDKWGTHLRWAGTSNIDEGGTRSVTLLHKGGDPGSSLPESLFSPSPPSLPLNSTWTRKDTHTHTHTHTHTQFQNTHTTSNRAWIFSLHPWGSSQIHHYRLPLSHSFLEVVSVCMHEILSKTSDRVSNGEKEGVCELVCSFLNLSFWKNEEKLEVFLFEPGNESSYQAVCLSMKAITSAVCQ
jgi:hypothetical protein